MKPLRAIATFAITITIFTIAISNATAHNVLRKINALSVEARKLGFQGKYKLGIRKAREGLELAEETFGANDALLVLADLFRKTARHSETMSLYKQLIKIRNHRGETETHMASWNSVAT